MARSARGLSVALLLVTALLTAPALVACSVPMPNIDGGAGDSSDTGENLPDVTLPVDFPPEVPLVDGEIKLATKATDASWMVTVVVPDETALDDADRLLAEAGFTELSDDSHTWRNESYNVIITSANTSAGFTLNYIVGAK